MNARAPGYSADHVQPRIRQLYQYVAVMSAHDREQPTWFPYHDAHAPKTAGDLVHYNVAGRQVEPAPDPFPSVFRAPRNCAKAAPGNASRLRNPLAAHLSIKYNTPQLRTYSDQAVAKARPSSSLPPLVTISVVTSIHSQSDNCKGNNSYSCANFTY